MSGIQDLNFLSLILIPFVDRDSARNVTIEERIALLEIQVVEIEEDVTGLEADFTDLEGDVDFLFDEQIIQDERLFSLEQSLYLMRILKVI